MGSSAGEIPEHAGRRCRHDPAELMQTQVRGADDRSAGPEEARGQERGPVHPPQLRAVKSVGTEGVGG